MVELSVGITHSEVRAMIGMALEIRPKSNNLLIRLLSLLMGPAAGTVVRCTRPSEKVDTDKLLARTPEPTEARST